MICVYTHVHVWFPLWESPPACHEKKFSKSNCLRHPRNRSCSKNTLPLAFLHGNLPITCCRYGLRHKRFLPKCQKRDWMPRSKIANQRVCQLSLVHCLLIGFGLYSSRAGQLYLQLERSLKIIDKNMMASLLAFAFFTYIDSVPLIRSNCPTTWAVYLSIGYLPH